MEKWLVVLAVLMLPTIVYFAVKIGKAWRGRIHEDELLVQLKDELDAAARLQKIGSLPAMQETLTAVLRKLLSRDRFRCRMEVQSFLTNQVFALLILPIAPGSGRGLAGLLETGQYVEVYEGQIHYDTRTGQRALIDAIEIVFAEDIAEAQERFKNAEEKLRQMTEEPNTIGTN